ncbi:protein neuralized-like isoform X1 [Tachypleus tridentatus]|uniref:protein neuralized-like isoform X1 n=2 Tax=Tachypleus tridentatus TaxID=6853 RepID=UPI003FD1BE84
MKFHSIHGRNIQLIDGDTRAVRTVSFCDAITFGNKPLSINSRISVQLNASEEWSGALRLGVTSHDPSSLTPSMLPRFACPDVFFKDGFWARPIPEEWAKDGTKLTFYVNSQGYFHVFVNNEHKGHSYQDFQPMSSCGLF